MTATNRRRIALASILMAVFGWTTDLSTADVVLVSEGSVWKYLDNGSDQGTAWRAVGFNDSAWSSGGAQLGYGDGDEATIISYGPNPSATYITTYFRQTFSVGDPTLFQSLTLELLRDDGAVAYLNGTEVFRSNMPTGTIAYNTGAASSIGGAAESTFFSASISPSLLKSGANVLAVEVHQANGASSDVSFDAALIAATSLQITRGPYLQMGTSSGVTVRWRTSGQSDSRVQYGLSPTSLTWSAHETPLTTEHEVRLSGLSPNTRYYYDVGSSTDTIAGGDANHFFITAPSNGQAVPTRVWVLGDSGTADANARAVRDAYYSFAGSTYANLWLMLGDNAYESGLDTEYQAAVFNMYPATLRQSVLWPTLGNHDGRAADSSTGTGPYYDMFTLPTQGEAGGLASGSEAYYSFDYGNIHFINLESFETDRSATGPMMTWLHNDIASTTQPWIIAFFHHPPYSKGSHDSDVEIELLEMRENALPILEAGGVDLVLSGHSHSYERSFLLDGHYGASSTFTNAMKKNGGSGREDGTGAYQKPTFGSAPHEGAVYSVAGSSGKISGGPLNHPAMYVSMNVLGSMVLDIDGNRLDAKFIDNTGAVRDYFTLEKGGSSPPPPDGSNPIPQTNWTLHFVDSQEPTNYAATNAFDGNTSTFWHTQYATAQPPPPHEIQINLGGTHNVSGFRYLTRQDGWPSGRLRQYEFFVSSDGVTWGTPVAAGTLANVATEQQVLFTAKVGRYIRLRALTEVEGRPFTAVAELKVLSTGNGTGNVPPDGAITAPTSAITIAPGQTVTFSGTGSDSDNDLPLTYLWNFGTGTTSTSANPGPVTFPSAGVFTVTFTVTDSKGLADPVPAIRTVTVQSGSSPTVIPQTNWTLRFVDSQDSAGGNYAATNAFDGNTTTFWHTQWSSAQPPPPHEIQINLGGMRNVSGFRYLPRQDGSANGRIAQYEFFVSADGVTWGTAVAAGTLANTATEQQVLFTAKLGQYIRLRALSEVAGRPYTAVAELNVLSTSMGNTPPDGVITAPASNITIAPGQTVSFSGTGADPDNDLPLTYLWNFGTGATSSSANPGAVAFPNPGVFTVTFTVTDSKGLADPVPATRTVTVQSGSSPTAIPHTNWTLHFVDSQDPTNYAATNAFDGNTSTFWHTQYAAAQPPPPHEIQINLGGTHNVSGFRYLTRQDGWPNGRLGQYEFFVSSDGVTWGAAVAAGTLANTATEQQVLFTAKLGRYIRLRALTEVEGRPFTAVAELNVLSTAQ